MKTIKIKKTEFQKLYNIACDKWKSIFNDKFKDFLFNDYIEFDSTFLCKMHEDCTVPQLKVFNVIFKEFLEEKIDLFKIDTYEKVCKQLKEKEETCPYKKIKQIERLFNGNWKTDFKDHDQCKYYPYFEDNNGLVFHRSYYCCCSFSGLVAFYKSEEISNFVGKTFIDIYQELSN